MTLHRHCSKIIQVANRNFGSRCALVALATSAVIAMAGCRGFGSKGPVPDDVAQARQLSQHGLNAIQRGDWAAAETSLSEAVKTCPVDVEARRHYAEAMWRRGEYELALKQLQQAMACDSTDTGLMIRAGQMHLDLRQPEEARALADRSLDLSPQSPEAWMLRGRIELAENHPERALADFHRALEFAPRDRDVLLQTAEAYRIINRPQRALGTLINLQETYAPGEEPQQVYYLEGLALQALGRPADAAIAYQSALERGEPSPDLYCRLGEAQLAAGHRADADRAIEQALGLDPNHPGSRSLRQKVEIASRPVGSVIP